MTEELMKVIVDLVQTGGNTAVWLVVILQIGSLLQIPLTFLGLWVLLRSIQGRILVRFAKWLNGDSRW